MSPADGPPAAASAHEPAPQFERLLPPRRARRRNADRRRAGPARTRGRGRRAAVHDPQHGQHGRRTREHRRALGGDRRPRRPRAVPRSARERRRGHGGRGHRARRALRQDHPQRRHATAARRAGAQRGAAGVRRLRAPVAGGRYAAAQRARRARGADHAVAVEPARDARRRSTTCARDATGCSICPRRCTELARAPGRAHAALRGRPAPQRTAAARRPGR